MALAATSKLKSRAPGILKVLLEAALDLSLGRYEVSTFVHIPGVTNIEADALSRLTALEPKPFPASLVHVPEARPADHRAEAFWLVKGSRRAPGRRSCA